MRIVRLFQIRKALLLILVFLIPYQNVLLFNINYLFIPMVIFILYFLFGLITSPEQMLLFKSILLFILPMIILWILLLILNLLYRSSEFYSEIARSYLTRFGTFLSFFVLFVNEVRLDNSILKKIPIVYIFSMLVIFIAFQLGINAVYSTAGRLVLFGINPNTLGFLSLIAVLFSLNYIFDKQLNHSWRIFFIVSLFVLVFLIGQTGSRGAIISLAAGVLIYFTLLQRPFRQKILILVPSLMLIALMGFMLLNTGVVRDRFVSEADRGDFGSRKPIWEASWEVIMKKPLFGIGPAQFDKETTNILGRYRSQHNEYLRLLGYSGFVGLSLFLFFLYRLFANVFRKGSKCLNFSLIISLFVASLTFMFAAGSILWTFSTWFVFAFTYSPAVVKQHLA